MPTVIELAEFRCNICGHLFFKGILDNAMIEIKCSNPRCQRIITLSTNPTEEPSKTCELWEGIYYINKII